MPKKNNAERATSCGSCRVDRFAPPIAEINPSTKKINIYLSFAEANRLRMAIEERLQQIQKLKRNSKEAKSAAVNLVITTHVKNVAIMPGKLTHGMAISIV